MTFVERVNQLCQERNLSQKQLEQEAGLGSGTTTKWKKSFKPNAKSLQRLSEYFGVSVSYLLGESEFRTQEEAIIQGWNRTLDSDLLSDESKKYEKGQLIPVLGSVHAGIPIDMEEDIIDWEEISVRLAKTGKFFALRIKGDSMSPRIQDGDVVIVKQEADAESGSIVIAKVNGNKSCCRKLIKHQGGIALQSLNPVYEPLYFTDEKMKETPVIIIGKVVELRAKF